MEQKKISINKVGILTICGVMAVEAVNFFLIPIMTRALGTSGYGVVSIYTAWCTIIAAICGLQTTQAVIYIIIEKDELKRREYLASMLVCSTGCFFVVGLAALIISTMLQSMLKVSIILIAIAFLQSFGAYCVNFFNTVATQEQKPIKHVVMSIGIALSTAILSIVLISAIQNIDDKYYGRILGYAAPYFFVGFGIAFYFIAPYIKKIRLAYVKELLPLCLPIVIHSLAGIVFAQSDRVMLGYICDESVAGIYSFTYSISSLLSVAWVTLNSFFQPFLFGYLKSRNTDAIKVKTANLLSEYTALFIVFILMVPEPATWFGGKEFAVAIDYIPILALGVYFNFLYTFNSNIEIYYKETKMIAKGTLLSAILNIVLNALLIPRYSIMGAAIATVLSCMSLYIFHHIGAAHVLRKHGEKILYSRKTFYIGITIAMIATALFYVLREQMVIRYAISALIIIATSIKIIKQKSII